MFVFFTSSLSASGLALQANTPDGVYALLATHVELNDSAVESGNGYSGVEVTGAASLHVTNSVFSSGVGSHGIKVAGVANVRVQGSLLSQEAAVGGGQAGTFACTGSNVVIDDSVLCMGGDDAASSNPLG